MSVLRNIPTNRLKPQLSTNANGVDTDGIYDYVMLILTLTIVSQNQEPVKIERFTQMFTLDKNSPHSYFLHPQHFLERGLQHIRDWNFKLFQFVPS